MDIQEIRKQLEKEAIERKTMVEDEPAAAPGPVSDTVQGMFDRTVKAIDEVHIADLTKLTTSKEIYDAVEEGKQYKCLVHTTNIGTSTAILYCHSKDSLFANLTGASENTFGTLHATVSGTSPYTWEVSEFLVDTPVLPQAAANKAYVDSHTPTLPKSLTLIYDDGTTEVIKVGQ